MERRSETQTVDEPSDRFRVTILRPTAEETPEGIRLGYGMLAKVIADAIRRQQVERAEQ